MRDRHARTIKAVEGLSADKIRALIDRYCRPDMSIACRNKFGFELDKETLLMVLADEEAHRMLLEDIEEITYKNMRFEDCPKGLHEPTFNVAVELDENQFDALIERFCDGNKSAKYVCVKTFGFELDRKTLEWLKENKPIYEFLE